MPEKDTEKENQSSEAEEIVRVGCSFKRKVLDELKRETGADADATAVSCFVHKNLNK